tara:strand:- start:469 stop:1299 length:831 start_codon:yes stop_codon:yes gene_type:complete
VKDRNSVQYYGEVPMFSWIDLNPVELCNRTCFFCPRGHDYPNTNQHMSIDVAKKLRDSLVRVDYAGTINICGNGEPLLHKNIYELVETFSDMWVTIVTNGDKLDKNIVYNLFQSGLKHINVSLYDGEYQELKFIELFESLDITSLHYTLRHYYKSEELDYGISGLNNRAGIINYGDPMTSDRPCYYMHYSIAIDWNGDVLFCVQDVYGKVRTFGNICDTNVLDIWNGDDMNNYRKGLLIKRSDFTPCVDCNVNGTKFGSDHAMIWSSIYENENNTT